MTTRVPSLNTPFLKSFRVKHGPAGLLGRFFLVSNERLEEKNLTLSFASFDELVEVCGRNRNSWGFYNPMFDPGMSNIDRQNMIGLACRNSAGEIVATIATKNFDTVGRSLVEIVDSGDFFGVRTQDNPSGFRATLKSASAEAMFGPMAFLGGIWIHPDYRSLRLPAILAQIMTAVTLTVWNPQHFIGFVRNEQVGTDLQKRYGYEHLEGELLVRDDSKVLIEAALLVLGSVEAADYLAVFLDDIWPQIDAAVSARSRQKQA